MQYDYIVIGAGSAGAIIASRLSKSHDKSVLLLEGGPDYPKFENLPADIKFGYSTGTDLAVGDEHDWGYTGKVGTQLGTSERRLRLPRGKITGGTSSINGQIFLRGLSHDFNQWKNYGLKGWNYEDVLPFFRKLETDLDFSGDFHGTRGPIAAKRFSVKEWTPPQSGFHHACQELGFQSTEDLNHPEATGVGPFPCNNPGGIRLSTSLGYLSNARHRVNFTIRDKCVVKKILLEKNHAVGVEVNSNGQTYIVEGRKIILSAGALASPHILLLSGIGAEDHLKSNDIPCLIDLPGVGENLRDHPQNFVTASVYDKDILDTKKPRLQVGLRYTAENSEHADDMLMWMGSYAVSGDYREILPNIDANKPSVTGYSAQCENDLIGIQITTSLYFATSSGTVKLNKNDPSSFPEITLNLLDTQEDVDRMSHGIKLATEIMKSRALSDIVQEVLSPSETFLNDDELLTSWLRQTTTTGNHLTSSCAMGNHENPMSVVDENGKVYGVENLHIADASIMPNTVRANTNVTTMMIAEKISSFLTESD